jgi:hypothetical protein
MAAMVGSHTCRADYVSPYVWAASVTNPAIAADFEAMPRVATNYVNWSPTSYEDWNDYEKVYVHIGAWGPDFIPFPAPTNVLEQPLSWQQLRLAASANVMRGLYPYAHHHMQVWDPPNASPWTNVNVTPGPGIDCSDFTHWNYSYGLGVQFTTAVAAQGEICYATLTPATGDSVNLKVARLFDVQAGYTKTYSNLVEHLQIGDLLFIRANPALTNVVSHVITWLGDLASDSNGIDPHLIMDSHGAVVIDSNGVEIPSGPQIRPFLENSYYFGSFDHVIRILPLAVLPQAEPPTLQVGQTNNALQVTLTGSAGLPYVIQNLPALGTTNWVNVATNFAPFTFTMSAPMTAPGFYRAVSFP